MFSDALKLDLEKEVVGQPQAVNSVVRGVTRVFSGLTPRERPLCAYLLMGPTGTGKSHIVRTLARILHGDERRLVVADCSWGSHGDPWMSFVTQLGPLFEGPAGHGHLVKPDPLSIVMVESLEAGPRDLCVTLSRTLESGHVMLPEGRHGSLENCLIFLTSSLCSREILAESAGIGFTGSCEDEDAAGDTIYRHCREEAERQFGAELLGQIDGLVIFRRLEETQLAEILERRFLRMNQGMSSRGFQCELHSTARAFLIARGNRHLVQGARDLVQAHRKFVEFPVADLFVSGRIPRGGRVIIEHRDEEGHLHFAVQSPAPATSPRSLLGVSAREIRVS